MRTLFSLERRPYGKTWPVRSSRPQPEQPAKDNLAFMCLSHHSLFDSTTSQHKDQSQAIFDKGEIIRNGAARRATGKISPAIGSVLVRADIGSAPLVMDAVHLVSQSRPRLWCPAMTTVVPIATMRRPEFFARRILVAASSLIQYSSSEARCWRSISSSR